MTLGSESSFLMVFGSASYCTRFMAIGMMTNTAAVKHYSITIFSQVTGFGTIFAGIDVKKGKKITFPKGTLTIKIVTTMSAIIAIMTLIASAIFSLTKVC